MKTYNVKIVETTVMEGEIEITAETEEKAKSIAREMSQNNGLLNIMEICMDEGGIEFIVQETFKPKRGLAP